MKKPMFGLVIGATALALTALPAMAQLDLFPPSDSIEVHAPSHLVDSKSDDDFIESGAVPTFLSASASANASTFGSPTYVTDASGIITDIFGVANFGNATNPDYRIAYLSDAAFFLFGDLSIDLVSAEQFFGPQAGWINGGVEHSGPYDITGYIDQTGCPGCAGTFQSNPDPVPDGGMTITLLGTALAGIGLFRSRTSVRLS